MKKIVLLLMFISLGNIFAQNVLDKDMIRTYLQKKDYAKECLWSTINNDSAAIEKAIQAFDDLFAMPLTENYFKLFYHNYADLLAQKGQLQKAVVYYDKAYMEYKTDPIEWFSFPYRKEYFKSDTALYNRKLNQYKSFTPYTSEELEWIFEAKKIFAIDQYARLYYAAHPDNSEILHFADSVTMSKMLELRKKYPDIEDHFQAAPFEYWVISRHIFTAYPVFWFTHFEPKEKQNVLKGLSNAQTYAFMYDRCIHRAYKQESYYGEWVADEHIGKLDTAIIDQRRAEIYLPSLKEKNMSKNIVQPIYE